MLKKVLGLNFKFKFVYSKVIKFNKLANSNLILSISNLLLKMNKITNIYTINQLSCYSPLSNPTLKFRNFQLLNLQNIKFSLLF